MTYCYAKIGTAVRVKSTASEFHDMCGYIEKIESNRITVDIQGNYLPFDSDELELVWGFPPHEIDARVDAEFKIPTLPTPRNTFDIFGDGEEDEEYSKEYSKYIATLTSGFERAVERIKELEHKLKQKKD